MHIYTYVYIHIHTNLEICICYICMYICVSTCIYVTILIYTYTYMYIYIDVHGLSLGPWGPRRACQDPAPGHADSARRPASKLGAPEKEAISGPNRYPHKDVNRLVRTCTYTHIDKRIYIYIYVFVCTGVYIHIFTGRGPPTCGLLVIVLDFQGQDLASNKKDHSCESTFQPRAAMCAYIGASRVLVVAGETCCTVEGVD